MKNGEKCVQDIWNYHSKRLSIQTLTARPNSIENLGTDKYYISITSKRLTMTCKHFNSEY